MIFAPRKPAKPLSWKQQESRQHVRDHRWSAPGTAELYNPREAKRRILACLAERASLWTSHGTLWDATKMAGRLVDLLLGQMVRQGRLEFTELYYGAKARSLCPEGTINPGHANKGDYQGYAHGYRLAKRPTQTLSENSSNQ